MYTAQPVTTADDILAAAETLLLGAEDIKHISARKIAALAGVNPSAVSYHFGSRENLMGEVIRRVYRRFSFERLSLLQLAVDAAAPGPAALDAVIAALVGPSVRWSLAPRSNYMAFVNLTQLQIAFGSDAALRPDKGNIDNLKPFVAVLRRTTPWFSEAEIGLRIHGALGIRANVLRDRLRLERLTASSYDLSDPESVIGLLVGLIGPMFYNSTSTPGRD